MSDSEMDKAMRSPKRVANINKSYIELLTDELTLASEKIKILEGERSFFKKQLNMCQIKLDEKLDDISDLKVKNKRLAESLTATMRYVDHAYGCAYGGAKQHKKTEDPAECNCDCGMAMRDALKEN